MTRYVLGAFIVLAIIVGIGVAVQAHWFGSSPAHDPAPVHAAAASTSTPHVDASVVHQAMLLEVTGRVEKRAGTMWVALHAGERLTSQDTIRTAPDAQAKIDIGAPVLIAAGTEITVGEITASVSQLSLTEGRIQAKATGGGPVIRIATRDTDAVAEADAGTFDVQSNGHGQVTVAAEQGKVKLTAKGNSVDVPAGQYSVVSSGEAPSAPTAIPASLFLKVSAAGAARDRTALRGETMPGSLVVINGVPSTIDASGAFTGEVALHKGDNVIVVSVTDALGRREEKLIRKTVAAASAPRLETEVQWK